MGRHDRERRRAPSLPRCCECGKAVGACFMCEPGGMHMCMNGRLQHGHVRCVLRFNEHRARENAATQDRRARIEQRWQDKARNGYAGRHP